MLQVIIVWIEWKGSKVVSPCYPSGYPQFPNAVLLFLFFSFTLPTLLFFQTSTISLPLPSFFYLPSVLFAATLLITSDRSPNNHPHLHIILRISRIPSNPHFFFAKVDLDPPIQIDHHGVRRRIDESARRHRQRESQELSNSATSSNITVSVPEY